MSVNPLMTQVEFARHRGVGKSAVSNWKKAGLIVLREGDDGRVYVDVTRSDAKLNAKIDPMRGRPATAVNGSAPAPVTGEAEGELPLAASAAPAAESLQSLRGDLLREQRVTAALKNAQLADELAAIVELELRASALGRAWRDRTHAWFRGVAEQLAATRELRIVMSIGEEGIDAIFADLAKMAAAGELVDEEPEDPVLEAEAEAEMIAAITGADE